MRPRPHEVEVVTVGVNLKSHHNHELKPGTELEVLKIVFLLPLLLTTPRILLRGRPLLLLPWKIHRQCNWSKINLSSQLVSKPLPSSSPQLLSFIFYRLSPFRVMGGAGANPSSNWVRVENAMNSSLLHHRSLSSSTLGSIQCTPFVFVYFGLVQDGAVFGKTNRKTWRELNTGRAGIEPSGSQTITLTPPL